MSARVLVVALDGAGVRLLNDEMARGSLPALKALTDTGRSRALTPPPTQTDDAVWACFQFGSLPEDHGRFFWKQRQASGTMGMKHVHDPQRDSFWDGLSDTGARVAIVDLPKCGAPKPLNGIHLVDWLVHGRYFREPQSHPADLAGQIVEQFGAAPPSRCAYEAEPLDDDEIHQVTGHLLQSVRQKRDAALHLLRGEAWDLFAVGFKEAHCAGHQLWDLVDPTHPGYEEGRDARVGHPIRKILAALDQALGALVEAAGPGATRLVFTTSDMVPTGSIAHLMPAVVDRMNERLRPTGPWRRLGALLRAGGQENPVELIPYTENGVALRVHGGGKGERLDQEEHLDQVARWLKELRDPETGGTVIERVTRPARGTEPSAAPRLPDLLGFVAAGCIPTHLESPDLGTVSVSPPSLRPGDHAGAGLAVAGPGIDLTDVDGFHDLGRAISSAVRAARATAR